MDFPFIKHQNQQVFHQLLKKFKNHGLFYLTFAFFILYQLQQVKKMQDDDVKVPRNIKNIYVRKIHSLLHISGDDIGLLHKEKKIKKTSSALNPAQNILSKKEKNKESARKARLRKKIYIDLLEKVIYKMENWCKSGAKLEKQSEHFLSQLHHDGETVESFEQINNIDLYLNNEEFQNEKVENKHKIKEISYDIGEYAKQISGIFYPTFEEDVSKMSHDQQEQLKELKYLIEKDHYDLGKTTQEIGNLVRKCEESNCKVQQQLLNNNVKSEFMKKEMIRAPNLKPQDQDYNICYSQNLWLSLNNFLALKVEEE